MPEPTGAEPAGPTGTRKFQVGEAANPPVPAGSGSAAVPPPRERSRDESVEPTTTEDHLEAPEDRTPVDPWAGADTSGWDLPSAGLPPAPPVPPRPYSGLAGPVSAPPTEHPVVPPPPPAPTNYPIPTPPPAPTNYPAPTPPPAPTNYPAPTPPPAPTNYPAPTPPPHVRPGPKGYGPTRARKRRRWPWVLLLTIACCCGCPAYWITPVVNQFPASAALPDEVKDLRLREDDHSARTAAKLEAQVDEAHWMASDTFAGVYRTRAGKQVTVFGGTGFWFRPESKAEGEIARLTDRYALDEAQVFDTGIRGRHGRCAVGHDDGTDVVVCTSADHGSIATAVFTRLSVDDSATLLGALREQIVTRN
uniref:Uncharacterized protein n=1 Tax=Salinispora arenicola (strain CNS-205) TaxID=391037 RepID=A8M0Z5_SALAI